MAPELNHHKVIIGIECKKCLQEPFGSYNPKLWVFLHSKCGYCDEENAICFKWNK